MAVDWEAMKTEYITTDTSQSKLAKKYGVHRTKIADHCRKEKWVDQRNKYRTEAVQKTIQKAQEQDVKRLTKLMDATGKLIDVALRGINDEQQFNRYVVTEGTGQGFSETTERVFDKLDTKALKDLTAVLKDLTGMVRDFYDIPTAAQREQREQARQKAEIKKKRAEKDEAGGSITIIVPKDAEGLDA